jgi:hypothetical protein
MLLQGLMGGLLLGWLPLAWWICCAPLLQRLLW